MSNAVRQLCVLLSLGLAGLSFAWLAFASDGPVFPKGKGEHCVADTDFMRKNHMDVLLHQRDETVIDGIRGEPFSLVGCVDCHASEDDTGQMLRVDAEGQFCESCHSFAAVKIDCFGCHAAVPEMEDTASVQLHQFQEQYQDKNAYKHLGKLLDKAQSERLIFSGPIAKLHGLK